MRAAQLALALVGTHPRKLVPRPRDGIRSTSPAHRSRTQPDRTGRTGTASAGVTGRSSYRSARLLERRVILKSAEQ